MVTCDGAGASHDLVRHLDKLASRRGFTLTWSVGWELGERERQVAPVTLPMATFLPFVSSLAQRVASVTSERPASRTPLMARLRSAAMILGPLRARSGGDRAANRIGRYRVGPAGDLITMINCPGGRCLNPGMT